MYQIIILVLFTFQLIYGCYIGHVDSGECVKARYVLEGKLEFCGQGYSWFELHPDYEVCVPMETVRYIYIYILKRKHITYTHYQAEGRSAGLTVQNKDEWVKETYEKILEERLLIEAEYEDEDINELGISGETAQRFRENSDCQKAYKNFFCWANFPRCNKEGASMMMCRSVCENYMIACGFDYDLWRCGNERYMNGHGIEGPHHTDKDTGYPVYLRDFNPGHPFREGESVGENEDAPICTPGIYGSASTTTLSPLLVLVVLLISIFINV